MQSDADSGCFTNLDLEVLYEGEGDEVSAAFVLPVLARAKSYDRLTGFFNVAGLVAISNGIDALWRRGGKMRLVLGIHNVPSELLDAAVQKDEWADNVIAVVRSRLVAQLSSLQDELFGNRVATVAWMMMDGVLEVKVAAPKSASYIGDVSAIFHNKRLIFEDSDGHRISATGSPNETEQGLQRNYEDLTVHMSWDGGERYVDAHSESFDRIWNEQRPQLTVRDLDEEFAVELLEQVGRPSVPPKKVVKEIPAGAVGQVVEAMRKMPSLAIFNQGRSALYPHQERAFVDALSRWPIRVLLADEVGLGKTLEAGSVISYMLRFGEVKRVVILAPAAVTKQWQEELSLHFGLDAWRFDSASRTFVSSEGSLQAMPKGASPVGSQTPRIAIISAQLARGSGRGGHLFEEADELPDLLVVDEAHAARLRPDFQGQTRPTLVWKMLDDIVDEIPHLLLMTATPVQVHWQEYHALLNLLGLPSRWSEPAEYERTLSLLAQSKQPRLDQARQAVELLAETASEMEPQNLNEDEKRLLETLRDPSKTLVSRSLAASQNWDQVFQLFIRLHPAHLLTVRNTRSTLAAYGYKFPERRLHAPNIDVPGPIRSLYESVEEYLKSGYGEAEAAANPSGRRDIGFAKSSYHQRLASSLHACRLSLERRLVKLAAMEAGSLTGGDPEDESHLDEEEAMLEVNSTDLVSEQEGIARAVGIERAYIRDLTTRLDSIEASDIDDPKMSELTRLITTHLPDDQILVFSRYTDTLESCLYAFLDQFPEGSPAGHAMYTGQESWVDAGDGQVPATKQGVRKALDSGLVSVVFCSEAASEGLNLQSARVLINVDVPWNPARLEQRIGRIARLGQKATEVEVYNLWYPDSIEARIYSRLLARKDLYDLAVGEFPELISQSIKDLLAAKFRHGLDAVSEDPLERLHVLREENQHLAMQRIWGSDPEGLPNSSDFRGRMMSAVLALAEEADIELPEMSMVPGLDTSFTLVHPAVDALTEIQSMGGDATVGVIEFEDAPVGFCIDAGEGWRKLPIAALPQMLEAVGAGRPLPQSLMGPVLEDFGEGADGSPWLPDHNALVTVGGPDCEKQSLHGEMRVRQLSRIRLEA